VLHANNIGKHSRVASVAVREGVDLGDELIVKTNGDFIHFEGAVLYPIANIAEQDRNPLIDFCEGAAEVHVPRSVFPGPFPGLLEHLSMEFSQVAFIERVPAAHNSGIERPRLCCEDVLAFPFVQLLSCSEIRNQLRGIVRVERRIAGSLVEIGYGAHLFRESPFRLFLDQFFHIPRRLVFEGHRVLDIADVFCNLRARPPLGEFADRAGLWNDGVH
jgi:hypothetical protein